MFVQPCAHVAMSGRPILWFLLRVATCRVRPVRGLHHGMIVACSITDKNLQRFLIDFVVFEDVNGSQLLACESVIEEFVRICKASSLREG